MRQRTPLLTRLLRKLSVGHPTPEGMDSGCWGYTGYHMPKGYGHIRVGHTVTTSHRMLFVLLRGGIGANEADHRCLQTWCQNPWHCDAVSKRENRRRQAVHLAARRAA